MKEMDKIVRLTRENGIVIFSTSTCCMCYTIKVLFEGMGVKPLIYDIDLDPDVQDIERALKLQGANNPIVPTVYIGGHFVGSADRVISLHLNGKLLQMLTRYRCF